MKYTQISFILSVILLLLSCNKKQDKKDLIKIEESRVEEKVTVKNPIKNINIEYEVDYSQLNKPIRTQIEKLDKQYPSAPFYCILENNSFFIVSSNSFKSKEDDLFTSGFKYGIVNDSLEVVLKQEYDKIYNPNLVVLNCFEIKKQDKIGLFNYETNKTLEPQFDFIIPSSNAITNIAYGYNDSTWFQISNSNFEVEKVDFNPINVLKEIDFDITKINQNMMFDSYNIEEVDGLSSGFGVGIIPSYIEYFNLLPSNYYTDIVTGNYDVGIYKSNFKVSETLSLTNNIRAFIIDAFESGSDARGYELEKSKVLIYNDKDKKIDTIGLTRRYNSSFYCNNSNSFKMINDSIIEIRTIKSTPLYREQPVFSYLKIENGEFKKLSSNRIFCFTEYTQINKNYFKGCFVNNMSNKEKKRRNYSENVWVTEHLSINDLDIMRNEIYADYGYKFKSDRWKEYFSNKEWYKPKYNNVDELLSKKDSLNIIKILEVKNNMKNKEDEFIKKHSEAVGMAG